MTPSELNLALFFLGIAAVAAYRWNQRREQKQREHKQRERQQLEAALNAALAARSRPPMSGHELVAFLERELSRPKSVPIAPCDFVEIPRPHGREYATYEPQLVERSGRPLYWERMSEDDDGRVA